MSQKKKTTKTVYAVLYRGDDELYALYDNLKDAERVIRNKLGEDNYYVYEQELYGTEK